MKTKIKKFLSFEHEANKFSMKHKFIKTLLLFIAIIFTSLVFFEETKPSNVEAQQCLATPIAQGGGYTLGTNGKCGPWYCEFGNPATGGACSCAAGFQPFVMPYCAGWEKPNHQVIFCYNLTP